MVKRSLAAVIVLSIGVVMAVAVKVGHLTIIVNSLEVSVTPL